MNRDGAHERLTKVWLNILKRALQQAKPAADTPSEHAGVPAHAMAALDCG